MSRFDIWLNGANGAKQLTVAMLCMWRSLTPACGPFAESLIEFLIALSRVIIVIVAPFLFWLAPVIAIFTAHRMVSEDEVRARMRANMHRNGRGEI